MRTKPGTPLVAATMLLLLSGCTGSTDPAPSPTPTLSSDDVVETAEMSYASATLQIGIHPVVRVDDVLVLTLKIEAEDLDGVIEFGTPHAVEGQWSSDYVGARSFDGVRLADMASDVVAPTAIDDQARTVSAQTAFGKTGEEPGYVQIAFGDPGSDELAVYLPKVGLVTGIPVIDGEVPDVAVDEPLAVDAVTDAPVLPMVSYSYDTASSTREQQDDESVTISLAADVVFAFDSADLSGQAEQAITQAAAVVVAREPGAVQVIGHTDAVGADAYNQDLSLRRAQAVATLLEQLVDTETYPLEVSGRGEAEPIADNSTAEGSALNRRVSLTISTPPTGTEEKPESAPMPEIEGPVSTGAEGVDSQDSQTPVHVTSPGARMVDGHLVVTIDVERTDDAVNSSIGLGNLGVEGIGMPDDFSTIKTAAGIAVMNGSLATLPVFHRSLEGAPSWPLADVRTNSRIDGGQVRTFDLVYPRGIDVGDSVTVQLLEGRWRLTDIPVEK